MLNQLPDMPSKSDAELEAMRVGFSEAHPYWKAAVAEQFRRREAKEAAAATATAEALAEARKANRIAHRAMIWAIALGIISILISLLISH